MILLAAIWLAATVLVSCGPRAPTHQRRITGTCEGVCKHYLVCKGTHSAKTMKLCVAECNEVFSGVLARQAFEGLLDCRQAISFMEGDSGRGPGSTP